jgi:hypothetical protein
MGIFTFGCIKGHSAQALAFYVSELLYYAVPVHR